METEYEMAKKMFERQTFGNNPFLDGKLFVRYCKTVGISKENTKQMVSDIVKTKTNLLPSAVSDNIVDIIVQNYETAENFELKPVYFYQEELDAICECKNFYAQKMLFCMLYLYKRSGKERFEMHRTDLQRLMLKSINNNQYYSYEHELKDLGYVRYGMFKGKSYTEFVDERLTMQYTSNPVITITNHNNIIYYFLRYLNRGRYMMCAECGSLEISKGHGNKYCRTCAKKRKNISTAQSKKKTYQKSVKA